MPKPTHTRALIRHAIVRVLASAPQTSALLRGGVYANRMEHWLQAELPACGVYTLDENPLETDRSPDPEEKRITLAVELLAAMGTRVDDTLDDLSFAVEAALQLSAIGAAMTAITNEALQEAGQPPLEPVVINGIPRTSAADCLLTLAPQGTEIGIAVEGSRQVGVATLSFNVDYETPRIPLLLPDFLLAHTGWDVAPADGHIDMESRVDFPPATKE